MSKKVNVIWKYLMRIIHASGTKGNWIVILLAFNQSSIFQMCVLAVVCVCVMYFVKDFSFSAFNDEITRSILLINEETL